MRLKSRISALHVPHCKNTAAMSSVKIEPPDEVVIPMNMHSGSPAIPAVKPGEHVFLGQLIAGEGERNSAAVHASISGTVKEISEKPACGGSALSIVIKSDGKMEPEPSMCRREPKDLEEFLSELHKSGIVGLGGAAFPLWGKLKAAQTNRIKTVLVNGAECEPYITSDHRTMLECTDYIVRGVELLKKFISPDEFLICIEDNKPDAIEKLTEAFKDEPSVKIKPLRAVYPQGAKQVLMYNATGLVAKEGQRLASLGVIIINITSLAKMALYMDTGMPLVDRIVTVDGSAVKEPKNLRVPIGTPISYVLEKAGGLKCQPGKVIVGGPMMGKTVAELSEPVIKATNAVLVLDEEASLSTEPSACIHCGRCANTCPLKLNPAYFAKALEVEDEAERYRMLSGAGASMCMSCGCCSYVCPAHRPLSTTNAQAKKFVRSYKSALERKEAKG